MQYLNQKSLPIEHFDNQFVNGFSIKTHYYYNNYLFFLIFLRIISNKNYKEISEVT